MAGAGGRWTRRRRLALAGGVAVAVAVAAVAAVLAARPKDAALSLGFFFDVGPALRTAAPGPSTDGQSTDVATVTYRDGGLVRYAFDVRNDGPEAATITEVVGAAPPVETLLRPVAVGLAAPRIVIDPAVGVSSSDVLNADLNEPDVEPFHPFTLDRGEDRVVWVWARMTDCEFYSPGTAITLVAVRVRYMVAGDAREAQLTLPLGLRVNLPLDFHCPRSRPPQRVVPPLGSPRQVHTPAAVPPG